MRFGRPFAIALSAAFVVSVGLSAQAPEALAKKNRKRVVGTLTNVQTPLGLQGAQGPGLAVVPFFLAHARRKKHFVQVQYGWDQDESGVIDSNEFVAATHDIEDARDTGKLRRLRGVRVAKYRATRDLGSANALVWDVLTDLPGLRFVVVDVQRDEHGREILNPDPRFEESLLLAPGPGVKVRIRPILGSKNPLVGDWVETDAFSVDNATPPEVALGLVTPGAITTVRWSGISVLSEDADGDGILDVGEDTNGNGAPDFHPLAIAVDYGRVPPGETEVDAWLPCTQAATGGDPSTGRISSPQGQISTFAWDTTADLTDRSGAFKLRVRTYDSAVGLVSQWVELDGTLSLED